MQFQAYPAISGRRAFSGTSYRASLTVEAALSFPIIIFAIVLLVMPLKLLIAERKMQAVAETVCADVSKYAYTKMLLKKGFDIEDPSGVPGSFIDSAGSAALGEYVAVCAKDAAKDSYLGDVTGIRSSCMTKNDMITIILDYDYRLPFVSLFGVPGISQSVVSSRRAWVGRDGSGTGSKEDEEEKEDAWVWIGAGSTRYHLTPDCHYLSNTFTSGTAAGASSGQYVNGKKYTACARCGASVQSGQTIYVLPAGAHFHTSKECSALKAYVKKVRKSTVEHLGPCSYCGK